MRSFLAYIWGARNKIFLAIISALGLAVLTLLAGILQDKLTEDWTTAEMRLISSAVGAFTGQQSMEVVQLLGYEVSVSDLVKDIKVTAIFGRNTEIIEHNVIYTVPVEGFEIEKPQKKIILYYH